MSDKKEKADKPDTTHVQWYTKVWCARAMEYGNEKYGRSDYLKDEGKGQDALDKFREYLRALDHHVSEISLAAEKAEAEGLSPEDIIKTALAKVDLQPAKSGFRASKLPHLAHVGGCFNILVAKYVCTGFIDADPGRPWDLPTEGL